MTSIVRIVRDWWRGIPKDVALDSSQIIENLYIGAWPTKYNVEEIKALDVRLVISTILESVDKELGDPPLTLLKVRFTDAFYYPIYPINKMITAVEHALPVLRAGEGVMVFCKSGRHRSAAMSSCILIGLGHSAEEAIQIVTETRSQADLNERIQGRIKKFEKAWLEKYPEGMG